MNTWIDVARMGVIALNKIANEGITIRISGDGIKTSLGEVTSLPTETDMGSQRLLAIASGMKRVTKLAKAKEALYEFCNTCPDANRADGFRRKDVAGMFAKYGLNPKDSAISNILAEACKSGELVIHGTKASARYTLGSRKLHDEPPIVPPVTT